MFAAIDTWLRHYDRRRPHFSVQHTDGTVIDDGYFAICFNTDPYTFLGTRPLTVAPRTTLDTRLTMVTIRSLRLGRILGLAAGALRSGGVKPGRAVDVHEDVAELVVKGHRPFPYQVDGDYLGEVTSLRFRHEPDVIDLVLPDMPIPGS